MKYLFLIIACVLFVFSIGTYISMPSVQTDHPVIYWTTDANPAREEQVRLFHAWLVENGHVRTDAEGNVVTDAQGDPLPEVELKLDTSGRNMTKQIIHGVAGAAADVQDINPGYARFMRKIGVLSIIDEPAEEMGFSLDNTYEAVGPSLVTEDGQVTYPCNVTATMLWVNVDTFERFGVPLPPMRWTLDEFEEIGKKFYEATKDPDAIGQQHYFLSRIRIPDILRTFEVSLFNETLTASRIHEPEYREASVETMERIYRWTNVLNLLPDIGQAQELGTGVSAGYGGPMAARFAQGFIGMHRIGRFGVIAWREQASNPDVIRHLLGIEGEISEGQTLPDRAPLHLDVVEMPHAIRPVVPVATRSAGVYAASDSKPYAYLFLSYLSSEKYNMQIVRDGDALPPNPKYTETDAFGRPPQWPNEWGLHDKFSEAVQTIGVPDIYSPFVLFKSVNEQVNRFHQELVLGRLSPEECAEGLQNQINRELRIFLLDNPELREEYERRLKVQEQIDQMRANGEVIPAELIDNHYLRRIYIEKGWAE